MGNETILYYVTEESITGSERNVNIHFWRKIKLSSYVLENDDITAVIIIIPNLKKGWKKEKLLKLMQEAAAEYPAYSENAQVIIQPEVQQLCMSSEVQRLYVPSEDFLSASPVLWFLADKLLAKALSALHLQGIPESVVLLLGNTLFPEEQMRKFMDMMKTYFPRMNHLTILYETDEEETWEEEKWEETISEYTQEIYYEYGLVSQVRQGSVSPVKRHSVRIGQSAALFLDYGYPDTKPFCALKAEDIYLDLFSSEEKEAIFRRKYMEISYFSPRKYLDTMVKSSYDKLVNQALCQKITPENKV